MYKDKQCNNVQTCVYNKIGDSTLVEFGNWLVIMVLFLIYNQNKQKNRRFLEHRFNKRLVQSTNELKT